MPTLSCISTDLNNDRLIGDLSNGFQLKVDVFNENLVRVAIVPEEGFAVDRTWMIAPFKDCPWEGLDRLSPLVGIPCPLFRFGDHGAASEALAVDVELNPLRLSILRREVTFGEWTPLVEDRKGGAYQWLSERGEFRHFQAMMDGSRHYGLGDKAGPMDRTRRRFRMLQTDALGYDAEKSDPLYKHAPFLIAQQPDGTATGFLYETFGEIDFDIGSEHSNYFEPFRHVSIREKGMVLYVITGPKLSDVLPRLMQLTGLPAMPPRWSMGFGFSAMAHADHENAPAVISGFVDDCRKHEIPISMVHFGSGYTRKDDGKRYVFHWNKDRYPDPQGLLAKLKGQGIRLAANVKPVLLDTHPDFSQAGDKGWFVSRENGEPAKEAFWDGLGAQLDFSNPETINWWQKGIRTQVLDVGFDGVWNDNNEAELWDESASVSGFGKPINAIVVRPLHALLMTRASREATLERTPNKRPYSISRAGPIGLARYGETWSGDNDTSWRTLKWNLRQGLSMSLSGFPMVGHDIGGFSGPVPDEELLVRWFEMMALHPRAVMNSWKPTLENGTNLPFMYEDSTAHVRRALELRYRFLPYLYSLAYEAHESGEPIISPVFYHFDGAPESDTFMLGKDILVAPVVSPGASAVEVSLPGSSEGVIWSDFHTNDKYEGGKLVTLEAPLGQLPLLVRVGAILPLAKSWPVHTPHDANEIELVCYPGEETGEASFTMLLDDGETVFEEPPLKHLIEVNMYWDEEMVSVALDQQAPMPISVKVPTLAGRQMKTLRT